MDKDSRLKQFIQTLRTYLPQLRERYLSDLLGVKVDLVEKDVLKPAKSLMSKVQAYG